MRQLLSTRWLWAMVLVLSLGGIARAQTAGTGGIEGLVTDTSGAVLPGTTVTIRNIETNVAREAVTDDSGRYRAPALQPGRYDVAPALSGFDVAAATNVVVLVGQLAPVDFRMHAAGVAETVNVSADTTLIDTKRTDVSNVIDQNQMQNLPLNGRRWDSFVMLSPGVTNDGSFGLISYRGISGLYNNNMVDGADNNQAFFSEARGRTRSVYSISESSIKEFQVGVSNMSAEYGRAAGGTVNAVTKSGSNTFHGEGFYFLRDKAFQSQPAAPPGSTVSFIPDAIWDKLEERRQQFGVGVGGPLKKDKLFFFADYDQQHRINPPFANTSSATFYNGACTPSVANCDATKNFFHSLEAPATREFNNKVGLARVDWAINNANNFSVTYNTQRWNAPNGVQTPALLNVDPVSQNGTDIVNIDFAVTNLNTVIGQSWLNEVRGQIGRDYEEQVPNTPGIPQTSITGGITFGMLQFHPRPAYPHEQRYQILDNLTYFRGNHTFKVGTDISIVKESLINLFNGGGTYSYSSLDALATDCPTGALALGCTPIAGALRGLHYASYTQAFDLNKQGGAIDFSQWNYAFFVQDSWRVNDNIMVNAGLRWDYQRLPQPGSVETNGVSFNGNPLEPLTTRFNQDKKDWAPRLGVTYDIGARHDTVIRASYGLFYGQTSNSAVQDALVNNGVNQASYFITPTSPGAPVYPAVLSAPPTGVAGTKPDVHFFASDFVRPRVHSLDLAVDRTLPGNITVSASYLFSRGHNFPYFRDINLPAASATVNYIVDGVSVGSYPFYRGTRPNANFGRMIVSESAVTTNYNAMVLSATKRFSDGLLFNASYTLAKSEDNGQSSTTFFSSSGIPYDSLNFRNSSDHIDNDLAPSNNDRRHRFVGSFYYQPEYLWGVGVGGIATLESGLPLSQKTTGNVAATTGAVNTTGTNGTGGFFGAPWVGYNTDRQAGRATFDMRIAKDLGVGGNRHVQVLWEVFNLFNRANYANYFDTAFSGITSSYDAATNVVTVNLKRDTGYLLPRADSTNFWGARDMQFGLKFLW